MFTTGYILFTSLCMSLMHICLCSSTYDCYQTWYCTVLHKKSLDCSFFSCLGRAPKGNQNSMTVMGTATLPNVESTEHLHDMETAGQLLLRSAPQTLGSEMVQVWGRVLGGAEEIYLIDVYCFFMHSITASTHKFCYTLLHAYSHTESETHAKRSNLITILVQ